MNAYLVHVYTGNVLILMAATNVFVMMDLTEQIVTKVTLVAVSYNLSLILIQKTMMLL